MGETNGISIKYGMKDISNKAMTNEMAIDILQKNMPDPRRQQVLFDAVVKAILALRHAKEEKRRQ